MDANPVVPIATKHKLVLIMLHRNKLCVVTLGWGSSVHCQWSKSEHTQGGRMNTCSHAHECVPTDALFFFSCVWMRPSCGSHSYTSYCKGFTLAFHKLRFKAETKKKNHGKGNSQSVFLLRIRKRMLTRRYLLNTSLQSASLILAQKLDVDSQRTMTCLLSNNIL